MNRISAVAALAGLALTACGGSSSTAHHAASPSASATSSASPAATPSGAAFPSPTPGGPTPVPAVSVSCPAPPAPGEHLALVKLRSVSGIIVRDITNILKPVTRCVLGGGAYFRFISATRISYVVVAGGDLGAAGALYMVDLTSSTTSLVRAWSYGGYASWVYAWSPDGTHLTYLSSDTSSLQWHLLSAAGDRVLSTLGTIVGRDVNLDNDDAMVGFSADGQYVAVEQTFTFGKSGNTSSAPPVQVNRVSDGSIAYSRTDGTMGVWAGAGARFLFRTTAGVQAWSPTGGVSTVSSGSGWIHPWASPDGGRIAFSLLNAQGNHVGFVMDTTNGSIRQLSAQPRVGAAFLDAGLVWYAGESICTTATPCGLGGPPLSGQTYIYDVGGDVENGSIDTAFYDSWPHVVGQS